ncbi:unnamed protein product [Linum tenue]|uniref:Uncharacterized protein n=1 Tax=Linum tenue TaxID=586396 RepID=A0AAV0S8J8_9ROSI|nr:unnamed protein product [Linum tenue]
MVSKARRVKVGWRSTRYKVRCETSSHGGRRILMYAFFFSCVCYFFKVSNSGFEEEKEQFWIWLVWMGCNCWVSEAFLGL